MLTNPLYQQFPLLFCHFSPDRPPDPRAFQDLGAGEGPDRRGPPVGADPVGVAADPVRRDVQAEPRVRDSSGSVPLLRGLSGQRADPLRRRGTGPGSRHLCERRRIPRPGAFNPRSCGRELGEDHGQDEDPETALERDGSVHGDHEALQLGVIPAKAGGRKTPLRCHPCEGRDPEVPEATGFLPPQE